METNSIIPLSNFKYVSTLNGKDQGRNFLLQDNSTKQFGVLRCFAAKKAKQLPRFKKIVLEVVSRNNVYHTSRNLNETTAQYVFIFPASDGHVKFYSKNEYGLTEPVNLYHAKVEPFISQTMPCQWIYNLLEGRVAHEKILFRDNDPQLGFVLAENQFAKENKARGSFCAFVNRRDLRCLRDLTAKDIPLLENLLKKSNQVIAEQFDVMEIVAVIKYHPTYYHLHVHFFTRKKQYPGLHPLFTVIDNLKLDSDFYKNGKLDTLYRMPNFTKKFRKTDLLNDVENGALDLLNGEISMTNLMKDENSMIDLLIEECSKIDLVEKRVKKFISLNKDVSTYEMLEKEKSSNIDLVENNEVLNADLMENEKILKNELLGDRDNSKTDSNNNENLKPDLLNTSASLKTKHKKKTGCLIL